MSKDLLKESHVLSEKPKLRNKGSHAVLYSGVCRSKPQGFKAAVGVLDRRGRGAGWYRLWQQGRFNKSLHWHLLQAPKLFSAAVQISPVQEVCS